MSLSSFIDTPQPPIDDREQQEITPTQPARYEVAETYHIAVLGPNKVGKTSIINRALRNGFDRTYTATTGSEMYQTGVRFVISHNHTSNHILSRLKD